MRPKFRAVVLITVLALLGAFVLATAASSTDTQQAAAAPMACDWNLGDAHKMHFPQLPNPAGWDVIATDPIICADDWQCSESGPVKDIHFWGSWRNGLVGTLQGFRIQIWSDIPAASSPTGYSMPGTPLWQRFINIADIEVVEFDPGVLEGWYNPSVVPPEILPGDNPLYYQYNVCLTDPADWFVQDIGTIYWLVISTMPLTPDTFWGWKSTTDHFNDDAVWWDGTAGIWQELYEPDNPTQSMDLSFVITSDGGSAPSGACCYDGPAGPLCTETTQDSCMTFYFGTYLGDGTTCSAATEACCFQDGSCLDLDPLCCQLFGGTPQGAGTICLGDNDGDLIDDACQPPALRGACCYQDLATGQPFCIETTQDSCENIYFGTYLGDGTICQPAEACCLQDGTCQMLDPLCCELIGGIPEPGLTCLGEVWACCIPGADCQNLDPACCQAFGGTPIVGQLCTGTIEACCFQDGSCQNLDPTCCLAFGGTPQGAGTVCLGDNDGNNIDDACEQTTPRGACCYEGPAGPLCVETTQDSCVNFYFGTYLGDGTTCLPEQACCFQDGSCLMLDPLCCELFGGTPGGAGSTCSNPTACCLPDGSCEMLDPFCCEIIGGVPEPNLTCLGEVWACCIPGADCQNLDPACCQAFGGTPLIGTLCTGTIEACCFQDGSCQNLDPACCEAFGGTPQGPGTVCLGDNNGNMIDDACEQTPGEGACCVQTSCFITTAADCSAAGGTYFGDGTVCGIDANGNGIPDICDSWNPGDDHKMHYPQLPDEEGWDVKAFAPAVVSDDWQCTQTGPVSDIHFWGSWLHGLPGNILGFWISIHADIPASDSPTGYSMPGPLLWLEFFDNYNAIPINTDLTEGWYDPTVPPAGIVIPNDHTQYFQYNIFVEPDRWFYQKEGTIYWLDISAVLEDTVITKWGWKSSIEHFNDDATWGVNTGLCTVPDDGTGTADLPGDCPYTPQTDTAIIITGGLPAGTTIEADPVLQNPENVQTLPGGDLGGVIKIYTEILQMELTGTGGLGTFHRNIGIPVQVEVHLAPWTPGEPVQEFETDMVRLQGEIFGDPDFDMLRVTAGTGNGMPSPGHTTLTRLPSGNWNVDSFFDIEYRIDFQGAPGSVLQDFEGTTQGTIRLRQGGEKVPTWHELYEPPGFQVSMDMAFVITGEFLCDCRPGDPNNDGTVNITDAVYMINYIFGGGPAPTPYAVCSGDANCDCLANITDAVYLINYIFGGGSPPCDCPTWLSTCGPPLY